MNKTPFHPHGIENPRFYRTHSFQVFVSFVLFGTLLTAIYGFFIFDRIKELQTSIMVTNTQEVTKEILKYGTLDEIDRPIGETFFTRYNGFKELPDEIAAQLKDIRPEEESTFMPHIISQGKDLSVFILKEAKTEKLYYYIIDFEYFDEKYGKKKITEKALFKGWLISIVLSIIIGYLNARKMISPGRRLLDKVRSSNPENLPVDFAKEFKQDEIGVIATALEKSMLRIKAFIQREKQFTRDASHELRTPVTVIKGAVELIRKRPEIKPATLKRLTDRIERSVRDMEVLIEVFLIRAREEASSEIKDRCNVREVAEKVFEESQYLVGRKPVELIFNAPCAPMISASEPELKMTLSNLVRNAVNYTHSGHVAVFVAEDHVKIENTGIGIAPEIIHKITDPYVKGESSKGYGIGLSIVNRICSKYGWKLKIESREEETSFKIIF